MAVIGTPVSIDMERTEDDTNDVVVLLTNDDGTPATVTNWTGILSIGSSNDAPLSPPKTYPGLGGANGLIAFDMDGFDVPIGSYKYDIRITDTVSSDTPARVYFKGKFKVTPRID